MAKNTREGKGRDESKSGGIRRLDVWEFF